MLKSLGKLLVPALLLSMCAGCFRVESLIKLSQDGTGSIFLRCLVSESLNSKALNRDVSKVASELGEGVTFVSTKPHSENGWKGVIHEFAFEDINKLRLGKLFASMNNEEEKKANSTEITLFDVDEAENWRFNYKRGETNELIISHELSPKAKDKADPFAQAGVDLPKAPAAPTADIGKALAMSMVRPILTGASASLLVQVEGEIVSTNAAEKTNANSAYLFHLDLGKFAKSKEFDKAMTESWSFQRLIKEKVPGIKGMKAGEKVSIKFKNSQAGISR